MYTAKRPVHWPALLFLIATILFVAACGTTVDSSNWPGMTARDDTIFVAFGQGVLAVDISEEIELWSYRPSEVGNGVQLYAQPSVVENSMIVGDYGDSGGFLNPRVTVGIYNLDILESEGSTANRTPDEVWRNQEAASDKIIASPLQVGDSIFVGTADNFMLALDHSTGEQLWKFETDKPIWSRPVYLDGTLYLASLDGFVYAVDAEDGTEIWSHSLGGGISGNLVLENGLLYANSFNQSANALDLRSGELVWTVPSTASVWGETVVDGEEAYFVDLNGALYGVNALTGEVLWTEEVGELVQAAPAYEDGVIFLVTAGKADVDGDERIGHLLAISSETREVLWQKSADQPLYTNPLVVDDSVIIALNQGNELLQVFDRQDGSLTWTFDRPGTESEE